jgi:3-dehydroquinate dehydratase-1
MGEPKCEAKKSGVAHLEELQIDFVALSKHEGNMSTKPRGAGQLATDTAAKSKRNAILSVFKPGAVVGIVDSLEAARKATRLPDGAVDFLEWRADYLGCAIPNEKFPWIITARHPMEGGKNSMSSAARRDALSSLLPVAAIVDIEVRSLESLRSLVRQAQDSRVPVLASFHDFKKTPSTARLREVIRQAENHGANAIKIATHTASPTDVARLLDLFSTSRLPLAVMGMGPLGMASRILFANCGSVLNYGWLHAPNVPGQWAARELRGVLRQCAGQDRN